MIISCPDCKGKLSTSAPSCPHCGYIQKTAAPPPAAGPAHSPGTGSAPPDFVAPSRAVLQEAARRQWLQWQHDSFWPMAFGVLITLAVLGVLGLTIYLLNRASAGR